VDAITNNDFPPVRDKKNSLLSISFVETGTEPVTLVEVKAEAKIGYADEDTLIMARIKQCRKAMEKYTGLSLVTKTVTAVVQNSKGNWEFVYGPLQSFTSMADKQGTVITSTGYKIYPGNTGFPWLESPTSDYLTLVYEAGYTAVTIPDDLKLDLIRLIVYMIRHRGDEEETTVMKKGLRLFAHAHRRVTPIW
jgi:hypothetical protein